MVSKRAQLSSMIATVVGVLVALAGVFDFVFGPTAMQEAVGCLMVLVGLAIVRLGVTELHHAEMRDIAKRQLAAVEYSVKLGKGASL